MPPTNNLLIYTGTYTLVQALFQFIFSIVAIAQFFCVIDFLRTYPLLIYIRILYFHNPGRCGSNINVGGSSDELADQAFVYLSTTPHVTTRTLIFSSISIVVCVFWMVGSIILIKGGRLQHPSIDTYWPWLTVTYLMSLMDIFGMLAYFNDTFYTGTLQQLLRYIDGVSSGFGNNNPDTAWASWSMVILTSRFGVFLAINICLNVLVIVDSTKMRTSVTPSPSVSPEEDRTSNFVRSPDSSKVEEGSDVATSSSPSEPIPKIPRPGLSQSFRNMKHLLFDRSASNNSLHDARSRRNRVNFLRNETISDPIQAPPPSFENLIAEQQRRLCGLPVDTAGRRSPARASRSLPQLHNIQEPVRGKRSTGQLPSQMPWSYIAGAPTNRMRDQLPPDEDLPPVPLPDYTAFQTPRKASVHRTTSSLSSLTQKKDYTNSKSSHLGHRGRSSLSSLTQKKDSTNSKSSHPGSTHVDVLY